MVEDSTLPCLALRQAQDLRLRACGKERIGAARRLAGSSKKSLAAAEKTLVELKALLDVAKRVDGKLSPTTIRKAEKLLKDALLEGESQPSVRKAEFKARIIALACSPPPDGRTRWTIQLLADKAVELKIASSVSTTTIHEILKKANYVLT